MIRGTERDTDYELENIRKWKKREGREIEP
jgi:hypothetical protein